MRCRPALASGCVLLGVTLLADSVSAQTDGRPPDVVVTRLQGAQSGAAPQSQAALPRASVSETRPLVATELEDHQAATLDGPRRITMSASRPMPIGDLLLLLVNGTPFSLVTDNDVSGNFTGDLKELTMRQALEAVLFPRALDYDVQGTLLRVFPRRATTRLFPINFPNVRRTLEHRVANVASGSSADFYEDVAAGVQSLLSPAGRMHVDRTAGLIQVTDVSERLDQVGVYLETVQTRASRQVRVDARVLSVSLFPANGGGIDWSTPAIKSAAVMQPSTGYGPTGLSVKNVDALTNALSEQGTVTTVAAPHVVAMNNEPAVVRVGKERIYFDATASKSRGDKNGSPATVLEGLTLTVVAQLSADDILQLHVSPSYSALAGESTGPKGVTAPVLTVNEVDTVMRVRNGETIVLAGLLNTVEKPDTRNGFARLFGGDSRVTIKSEVVVLLTPRIIKPATASPN